MVDIGKNVPHSPFSRGDVLGFGIHPFLHYSGRERAWLKLESYLSSVLYYRECAILVVYASKRYWRDPCLLVPRICTEISSFGGDTTRTSLFGVFRFLKPKTKLGLRKDYAQATLGSSALPELNRNGCLFRCKLVRNLCCDTLSATRRRANAPRHKDASDSSIVEGVECKYA